MTIVAKNMIQVQNVENETKRRLNDYEEAVSGHDKHNRIKGVEEEKKSLKKITPGK